MKRHLSLTKIELMLRLGQLEVNNYQWIMKYEMWHKQDYSKLEIFIFQSELNYLQFIVSYKCKLWKGNI